MKIAFVCTARGPCPPVRGGAIQLLISEVAPLLARQHQVTVFSITDSNLPEQEFSQGVEYIRFPKQHYLKKVCAYLAKQKMDVIQLYNRPNWLPAVRKAAPNARLILSLHNRLRKPNTDKKKLKRNLKQADKIITVSKFIKHDTVNYLQANRLKRKFQVVYTGAAHEEYAPVWTKTGKQWRTEIRQKYGIKEDQPVILYVGRLVSYKGCHVLLKALLKKIKKDKKVTLLIVGSKWYADNEKDEYIKNLELMAQQSRNNVIFTAYIPVEEIPKYYAAADLFVNASQWKEPLARVHYEAMAAGLPIITTNRGGNREVIKQGKNGLIVREHKNHNHYRKAIKWLLTKPERAKKMGKKGREMVEKKYHFARVARDLEAIYLGLVK